MFKILLILVLSTFGFVLSAHGHKQGRSRANQYKTWFVGQCGGMIPMLGKIGSTVCLKCPSMLGEPYTFYRAWSGLGALSNTTTNDNTTFKFTKYGNTLNITSFGVLDSGIYKCVGNIYTSGSCNTTVWIIRPDPCSFSRCYNGGKCNPMGVNYNCTCLSPYIGKKCEIKVNLKTRVKRPGSSMSITCKPGATSISMAKSLDQPPNLQLQLQLPRNQNVPHRFTLSNLMLSDSRYYFCNYLTKSTGRKTLKIWRLIVAEESCSPSPCLNGGTCIPKTGVNFKCACASTYQGKLCQYTRVSVLPGGK